MAIENMPLDQLERMAKHGVVVAKKELNRRRPAKEPKPEPAKPLPQKRCTRCENGQPKDEYALWTGRRFNGGIVLCKECRAAMGKALTSK